MQLNSFSNFICGFVIENESMKRSICRESEARDDRAAAEAGRDGQRRKEREQHQKQKEREREIEQENIVNN